MKSSDPRAFSPFFIVASVPRSSTLPNGGLVVSYALDKQALDDSGGMFERVGHKEGVTTRTYRHSVLVMHDKDQDLRSLHALNTLVAAAPSVASRLVALYESRGRVTFWLERLLEFDLGAAHCACMAPELRDQWTPELRELSVISAHEFADGFTARVTTPDDRLDEQLDDGVALDELDRAVLEVGKIFPIGWASRAKVST
jgi:hypothetical protein